MPMPVSRTSSSAVSPSAVQSSQIAPAVGRVLDRVVEQVVDGLLQRFAVALTTSRLAGSSKLQRQICLLSAARPQRSRATPAAPRAGPRADARSPAPFGFRARQRQHVVDQRLQPVRLVAHACPGSACASRRCHLLVIQHRLHSPWIAVSGVFSSWLALATNSRRTSPAADPADIMQHHHGARPACPAHRAAARRSSPPSGRLAP